MTFNDFLGSAGAALGTIGSGLGLLQGGFNLFKDINGTDIDRQKQAQLELMQEQMLWQDMNRERQQQFNVHNMNLANKLAQDNMRLNHEFNLQSMDKQFAANAYLSNVGRSIIQQRQNGINPSGVGSSGGSVSALSPSGSSPGLPSVSIPSVSPPSISPSHYSGLAVDASNTYRNMMEGKKLSQEGTKVGINNMTELLRNRAQLKVLISEYKKNMSQVKNYDSSTDINIKDLEYLDRMFEAQIEAMKKKATHDEKVGQAAEDNAKTAAAQQKTNQEQVNENKRHNMETEAIQRVQNTIARYSAQTGRMQVNLNAEALPAVISELSARADQEGAVAAQKQIENKEWRRKVLSEIGAKEALTEYAKKQAELTGKQVEWYETKMAYDMAKGLIDSVIDAAEVGVKAIDAGIPF